MSFTPRTLMIFIDGLGIGEEHPEINPVYSDACPCLRELMREFALPIDACLDVEGTPQSATGQAALMTGVNAAKHMGRHMEGIPGPTLKELVRRENLYAKLNKRGYTSTFANGYWAKTVDEVHAMRRQSVSTVAALAGIGSVRTLEALRKNEAVYQDLTRELLVHRGYGGDTIEPDIAAEHLVAIAERHDFTLFEFFQTDLMAHRGTEDDILRVLSELDVFLDAVRDLWEDEGNLLVITSDHGNVEDLRTRQHTKNPVPFIANGHGGDVLQREVKSLVDFVPALLSLYPAKSVQQPMEHGPLET